MTPRAGLAVDPALVRFIEEDVLPGTGVDADALWSGLTAILAKFVPENHALLATRAKLQGQIDARYRAGGVADGAFLRDIGYLVDEPPPFTVDPSGVDPEVATMAEPQLVVPMLDARFLLNAANARWGSLYDALYGSDAIPGSADGDYNPMRGAAVIAWAKDFLDRAVPLATGRWADCTGGTPVLADPAQLVGRAGETWLLRHHGLHSEIVIDHAHPVGRDDPGEIADVVLEAAVTTICDLEDSVAAVDAADKVAGYANWLGLMRGDQTASFHKDGAAVERRLADDCHYVAADGTPLVPGRALLFVRNVGLLMTTPAVRLPDGTEAPEGIADAVVSALIALHDLRGAHANSRAGSIYIVKPKLHGSDEAAFTDRLFDAVEDLLALPRHTIKIGLMDEERRTSTALATRSTARCTQGRSCPRPRCGHARGSAPMRIEASRSRWPAAWAARRRSASGCGLGPSNPTVIPSRCFTIIVSSPRRGPDAAIPSGRACPTGSRRRLGRAFGRADW